MSQAPAVLRQVDVGVWLSASWRHWCPGCRCSHIIHTDPRAQPNGHHWQFDGNLEAPTFSPSVNIVGQCHYFVRAGRIEFCIDSKHELAGLTVAMVPFEVDVASSVAYGQGSDAWKRGQPLSANPHPASSIDHKHWLWGWRDAEEDDPRAPG